MEIIFNLIGLGILIVFFWFFNKVGQWMTLVSIREDNPLILCVLGIIEGLLLGLLKAGLILSVLYVIFIVFQYKQTHNKSGYNKIDERGIYKKALILRVIFLIPLSILFSLTIYSNGQFN